MRDGTLGYRPALDGLRAVAVLAVLGYHLGPGSPTAALVPGRAWPRGGFLGVDLFFVLSGYLITTLLVLEHGRLARIDLPAFWSRRARRLLPALLLVLLAVAAFATFWAASDQLGQLRGDGLATVGYFANWHFVVSGRSYFDVVGGNVSPLRHMWSLAIEEQFYLVWPLLVLGLLRLGRGRTRWLAVACVGGAAASAWWMAELFDPASPSRAYYGTDARAHELLIGGLLAVVLLGREPGRRANRALQVAGVLATAAMVWAFFAVDARGAGYYRGGSVLFSVAVAVVIAAAVQRSWSPLRAVLSTPPLRWLGQVSYGLYLWHWPIIVWLTPGRTGLGGKRLDLLRVAVTLVVTALSYYLLERPIRHGRFPNRRLLLAVPAAMALTAVVLLGATVGATRNPLDVAVSPTGPTAPPTTAPSGPTTTTRPGQVRPVRSVALVGDSVATTLADALGAQARAHGYRWTSIAFPGCGVAAGFMLDPQGHPFAWSQACDEHAAPNQEQLVAGFDPDVVIWLSTWEMSDRREHGEHLRYQTPAHDAALLADMERTYRRLSARGARLVLLLPAHRAQSDLAPADDGSDGALTHYWHLLRELAARHPGRVVVVPMEPIVCPSGPPCPAVVDGVRLRPKDGGHFSPETAPWVARRLFPEILASLGVRS